MSQFFPNELQVNAADCGPQQRLKWPPRFNLNLSTYKPLCTIIVDYCFLENNENFWQYKH